MPSQHEVPVNRVDYRWEEQDYDTLGRFIVYDTPIGVQIVRQQTTALVLLIALFALVVAAWVRDWMYTAIFLVILGIMMVPMRRRLTRSVARNFGKALRPLDPAFIGRDVEVSLLPDALELRTDWKATRYAWRAVHKIVRDDDNFYALMVDRNSLVIPLRAFHGTPHFQAIYDLAQEYHRNAHQAASDA